jgi:hypothetical protein
MSSKTGSSINDELATMCKEKVVTYLPPQYLHGETEEKSQSINSSYLVCCLGFDLGTTRIPSENDHIYKAMSPKF